MKQSRHCNLEKPKWFTFRVPFPSHSSTPITVLTLRRSSQLQPFFPSSSTQSGFSVARKLDRIYLDTSAFMGTGDMPEKESVMRALVTQMSVYPEDTVFFINAWCFGWEDVIKEVARCFNQPIHADRYKRSIYGAVQSDPFMLNCTTDDPTVTRFHACDRYNRCEVAQKKEVVQVVMVEVKSAAWELRHQHFLSTLNRAALGEVEWPRTIEVPVARHSPLPELQQLVKMFKPAALSPNTLIPHHQGMDFMVFAELLSPAISNDTYIKMIAERDQYFTSSAHFGPEWLSAARAIQSQLSALFKAGLPAKQLSSDPYRPGVLGISDAVSSTQTLSGAIKPHPSQFAKSESSHAVTSEPSQSFHRHPAGRLKRKRAHSSYRVNIAHLSDLAKFQ
ncbi:hypothetical protein CspeluHIS016_0305660 [Cutaneotrichosporon spelunceum]|uniref:DNA repair metallo-beta-lactamase domain-containing protein n=1 Tax=Cutaneotrichosporon spelunceum TaxID=1672016 RepID=A0AAD3TTN3_9TREE|nr:hypothetical protein CspeluHIS016_0305660 [Cutaneotrichosporon spelunceum]